MWCQAQLASTVLAGRAVLLPVVCTFWLWELACSYITGAAPKIGRIKHITDASPMGIDVAELAVGHRDSSPDM
ncbi:hypothetical protein [Mycobacterium uberis]|uniref:hypothetical protein n=1 Tax=Mycobacterium uberis TaxID=2162698 RepID=UPI001058C5CB|nr:hypothetical protein [Mycobacterium uberis]